MPKQRENAFQDKFKILSSQQNVEDINWTSSESSGYEDTSEKITKLSCLKNSRKRKRNPPKNLSNLSISILDTSRHNTSKKAVEKSPILITKNSQKSLYQSPISLPLKNVASSPILNSSKSSRLKSPVLISKRSPRNQASVRKKLFDLEENKQIKPIELIIKTENCAEGQDVIEKDTKTIENKTKAKLDLIKRVSSYFNSNFSSENSQSSPLTISQISTPKAKSKSGSEEMILTCKSDTKPPILKNDDISSFEESDINERKRKKRCKKGGLVYRLQDLVKKQSSRLLIWQHEKFLAATTSFIIPKEVCLVFRIQKVEINYGCHFLEMINENEEYYSLLIHSSHVTDPITVDSALKIYKPYKILNINESKLIINVRKFDCISYIT